MCIGAHELMMGDRGELGPLDVQIVKADEMDEQKSGLVAEAAFESRGGRVLRGHGYPVGSGRGGDLGGRSRGAADRGRLVFEP